MISHHKKFNIMLIFWLMSMSAQAQELPLLNLQETIFTAVQKDIWIRQNQHLQDSIEAKAIAAGALPDPVVSIGVANLAANSFNFSQEPMTNFKLGVAQMLPRGKSRQLSQQMYQQLADGFVQQRQNRLMQLSLTVGHLWLEVFKAQQSITIIHKNRQLFAQLEQIAEIKYWSAAGKQRVDNIIRAQLELANVDNRLNLLQQQKLMAYEKLQEWLQGYGEDFSTIQSDSTPVLQQQPSLAVELADIEANFDVTSENLTDDELFQYLAKHPAILDINQKIIAAQTNIDINKQKYKPAFTFNSSYGYRDNSELGGARSDFFSAGVSFDVPLFTRNKQDQEVKSAISQAQSIEDHKSLLLRNMLSEFKYNWVNLKQLVLREQLYKTQILPQTQARITASISAYTHDDGEFEQVVATRIAALNAEIENLEIAVEQQKKILQLNYFVSTNYQQMINAKEKEKKNAQ